MVGMREWCGGESLHRNTQEMQEVGECGEQIATNETQMAKMTSQMHD